MGGRRSADTAARAGDASRARAALARPSWRLAGVFLAALLAACTRGIAAKPVGYGLWNYTEPAWNQNSNYTLVVTDAWELQEALERFVKLSHEETARQQSPSSSPRPPSPPPPPSLAKVHGEGDEDDEQRWFQVALLSCTFTIRVRGLIRIDPLTWNRTVSSNKVVVKSGTLCIQGDFGGPDGMAVIDTAGMDDVTPLFMDPARVVLLDLAIVNPCRVATSLGVSGAVYTSPADVAFISKSPAWQTCTYINVTVYMAPQDVASQLYVATIERMSFARARLYQGALGIRQMTNITWTERYAFQDSYVTSSMFAWDMTFVHNTRPNDPILAAVESSSGGGIMRPTPLCSSSFVPLPGAFDANTLMSNAYIADSDDSLVAGLKAAESFLMNARPPLMMPYMVHVASNVSLSGDNGTTRVERGELVLFGPYNDEADDGFFQLAPFNLSYRQDVFRVNAATNAALMLFNMVFHGLPVMPLTSGGVAVANSSLPPFNTALPFYAMSQYGAGSPQPSMQSLYMELVVLHVPLPDYIFVLAMAVAYQQYKALDSQPGSCVGSELSNPSTSTFQVRVPAAARQVGAPNCPAFQLLLSTVRSLSVGAVGEDWEYVTLSSIEAWGMRGVQVTYRPEGDDMDNGMIPGNISVKALLGLAGLPMLIPACAAPPAAPPPDATASSSGRALDGDLDNTADVVVMCLSIAVALTSLGCIWMGIILWLRKREDPAPASTDSSFGKPQGGGGGKGAVTDHHETTTAAIASASARIAAIISGKAQRRRTQLGSCCPGDGAVVLHVREDGLEGEGPNSHGSRQQGSGGKRSFSSSADDGGNSGNNGSPAQQQQQAGEDNPALRDAQHLAAAMAAAGMQSATSLLSIMAIPSMQVADAKAAQRALEANDMAMGGDGEVHVVMQCAGALPPSSLPSEASGASPPATACSGCASAPCACDPRRPQQPRQQQQQRREASRDSLSAVMEVEVEGSTLPPPPPATFWQSDLGVEEGTQGPPEVLGLSTATSFARGSSSGGAGGSSTMAASTHYVPAAIKRTASMIEERNSTNLPAMQAAVQRKSTAIEREAGAGSKSDSKARNVVTLNAVLGRGSWGTVYSGTWRGLPVAIKTQIFLDAPVGGRTGGVASQTRTVMEAAVAISVKHRNVVQTYSWDMQQLEELPGGHLEAGLKVDTRALAQQEALAQQQGGREAEAARRNVPFKLFLFQELCGTNLAKALAAGALHPGGAADMAVVLRLLLDMASGLEYLHQNSILHGDLKPANVLVTSDAGSSCGVVAKLADFGLVNVLTPGATHVSNVSSGTPFYIAPEVCELHRASAASDIYAMGVITWQVVSCQAPYVGDKKQGFKPNPNFGKFPPATPHAIQALSRWCLAREPKARPSATQVVTVLQALATACPITNPTAPA